MLVEFGRVSRQERGFILLLRREATILVLEKNN